MILGIDTSTFNIDIVAVPEEGNGPPQWWRYPLTGADAFDRVRSVRDAMPSRGHWLDLGVIAVGIEDPRGHNSGAIYRIVGAVLACLPTSLLVEPLPPAKWRKTVGLAGNASKQAVAAWAHPRIPPHYGSECWPQDAFDALAIALAARALLEQPEAA